MWLGGGGNGVATIFVRYMSRKRAPDLRRIDPKVPHQEAVSIAEDLYNVIKRNGPISIPNTWNLAKEAGVDGLSSKTHMKIMLKWMRGKNMLKLICNHIGSNKKFFLRTLPEEPQTEESKNSLQLNTQSQPKKNNVKKSNAKKDNVKKNNLKKANMKTDKVKRTKATR